MAGATTYQWKLAKRVHTSGVTNGASVNATNLNNVNGLAISAKTVSKETFKVSWTESCSRGPLRKEISGSFTSHGIGTKTPIKLSVSNPDSCFVMANAAPSAAGSFYLTVWKR